MRILFVTGDYLPSKNGGIENYTHWLSRLLVDRGCNVEIGALKFASSTAYDYEQVKVNSLAGGLPAFEVLLKKGNFDICHFQEYAENGGIELPWFHLAKQFCGKVFFTFHLPYLTCYKLDFRYNGVQDCSTFSNEPRCTQCVIAEKMEYSKFPSENLLNLASGMAKITGNKKQLLQRIEKKHHQLSELFATADCIFVYAGWFHDILVNNGYDFPNLKKIPYKTRSGETASGSPPAHSIYHKILFVGRIQYQKGLHLLCEAMNLTGEKEIALDVYGDVVDEDYYQRCGKRFAFNYKGTTGYHLMLQMLSNYDFLVLPSVFTEMYSMIIRDAFFEGLPVIASAAKGNRDAVVEGKNGFLFEYNNAKDLALTIDKAYNKKRGGWRPVFTYPQDPEGDLAEIVSYYR